jgi:hypothetical protein
LGPPFPTEDQFSKDFSRLGARPAATGKALWLDHQGGEEKTLEVTFGERPAPATPASERLRAMRAGEAAGSPVPAAATAAAGLSTAVGEPATAAEATARRGVPVALADGSNGGTCDDSARATPPLAALAVGPAAGTATLAWVRVAPGLFAAV